MIYCAEYENQRQLKECEKQCSPCIEKEKKENSIKKFRDLIDMESPCPLDPNDEKDLMYLAEKCYELSNELNANDLFLLKAHRGVSNLLIKEYDKDTLIIQQYDNIITVKKGENIGVIETTNQIRNDLRGLFETLPNNDSPAFMNATKTISKENFTLSYKIELNNN